MSCAAAAMSLSNHMGVSCQNHLPSMYLVQSPHIPHHSWLHRVHLKPQGHQWYANLTWTMILTFDVFANYGSKFTLRIERDVIEDCWRKWRSGNNNVATSMWMMHVQHTTGPHHLIHLMASKTATTKRGTCESWLAAILHVCKDTWYYVYTTEVESETRLGTCYSQVKVV